MSETRPRNVVKLINCHALSSMLYERSSKENFFGRKCGIKQDRKNYSQKKRLIREAAKQPFLLFKYSDISVSEINSQFILSKKKTQNTNHNPMQ